MPAMDVDVDAKDSTNSAPNSDSHNDSLDVAPSGIIIPPHEFRLIADKTADFVARTGPQFEERVREMERGNPKFCFLNSNDPYYAYYQWKIQQVKAGKDIKPEEKKKSDAPSAPLKPVKPAPKQPPPFEFILDLPPVSAQDLDIIKLTALFAARNGRIFMSNLSQKERNNYQFDFMRPSHSLSAYFTKLVDHYTKLLRPTKALEERLHANSENKYKLLDRIMERVEYTMYQEEQKKKAEEEADAERSAYNSIDWHDFVVVQTIEFVEGDENLDLPPPLRVVDLENMTLAQKRAAMFMPEPEAAEGEGDGDMEME
ncbi:Pre-mRNA splicing factor PRP21 like protein-domain-containing protein, partial [Cladochytrium replicatum]